jgi:large repetitive protein
MVPVREFPCLRLIAPIGLDCHIFNQERAMNYSKRVRRAAGLAAVVSYCLLLTACDDGASSDISVGGNVSGLATAKTVVLANNGGSALSVSVNGNFTFPAASAQNGSYNVTVATQPQGQICSVSSGSGDHLVSSVSDVRVVCAASIYTISGSLSGLASGAKLIIEDNGADTLSLSANGSFAFAAPINFNGAYAVTVVTQPTGATCTVSNGIGAGLTAAVTNVSVACSTKTYAVSGALSGLPAGAQVVLQDNGADPLRLSANGAFKFSVPVAFDGSYAVTVSTPPTQATCSVTHGVGAGVTAAVTGVSVLCSLDTYTIAGALSGLAAGSQITLDDNAADALTVTANGAFTFATPVAAGGSFAVTVGTQPTGETCTVSGGQGTQLSGNVSNVSVTCATSTFTIGGTLSGLASGVQVTLDNNGADPLTLMANGTFTFATPVAYGGAYNVTVGTPPSGQMCTISNGAGTNVSSTVGNVNVACEPAVSFTSPGSFNWTVPAGVTSVQVVAIGAGGGGAGLLSLTGTGAAGGSGAQVTTTLSVTPGQVIALVVGGGGTAGATLPGGTCPPGGGGGGASSVGSADQVIAGGGGGGGVCGDPAYYGGSGGGADGAGGAGAGIYGGAGGSGGIGGIGGYLGSSGGNGSGGPGGAGGSNGPYGGGAGGSGVGGGVGGNGGTNEQGGGGGGYGGGATYQAGGGAGGSTGPSGTDYSAASNAGAAAMNGGDGSITFIY